MQLILLQVIDLQGVEFLQQTIAYSKISNKYIQLNAID